ncbi:MAG: hypothetical protein ACI8QS_000972 [Planctomycetota bacterium]|jgi:hypothetical protein
MTTDIAQESQDLRARMNRLEAEARRWRLGALGLGLALVGSLGLSAMAPASSGASAAPARDEIRAKRIVLVDADDNEVGALEVNGKGDPQLHLHKESRTALLTLSGPGILVRDGRRGAYLGLDSGGASKLELTGDNLNQGARVSVQLDGSTGFYALDEAGMKRMGMEFLASGQSQFTTFDKKGKIRSLQGIDQNENTSSILFDAQGLPRLGLIVPMNGMPAFASEDANGITRAQLIQGFDGSARLEFLSDDGKVRWVEPK